MERRSRAALVTLLTVSTCIAALHFGRAILMPVALGLLVTFATAPLRSRNSNVCISAARRR